jgi:hypothetical protein
MRGRGASGIAATVAASVASKVSGGSMLKLSQDSTKEKEKGKDGDSGAAGGGEEKGSRWWGKRSVHPAMCPQDVSSILRH